MNAHKLIRDGKRQPCRSIALAFFLSPVTKSISHFHVSYCALVVILNCLVPSGTEIDT